VTFRELQDQVFDLIAREANDPRAVDRVLATVPGGRPYFEHIKRALVLAELLPMAETPATLDAAILAEAGVLPPSA
jgi:hypothetical protein